jgi:hypothetical protein
MSDELNAPKPEGEPGPAARRSHMTFNVIGLALTLFGLVAAKSMYSDGNHILAFFVLGMLGIVWLELAAINVRDRRYNQRNNLQ